MSLKLETTSDERGIRTIAVTVDGERHFRAFDHRSESDRRDLKAASAHVTRVEEIRAGLVGNNRCLPDPATQSEIEQAWASAIGLLFPDLRERLTA